MRSNAAIGTTGFPRRTSNGWSRLMSDPASAAQKDEFGEAKWIEHLDDVCWRQRVKYDTEGQYMGDSSSEPSFPDNFMEFDERQHHTFLELPLQAQEEQILDVHLKASESGASEFFSRSTLGRLDSFPSFGCATGVVPTIAFWKVRQHLLELLADARPAFGLAPRRWSITCGRTTRGSLFKRDPEFCQEEFHA